ncbi:MAG: UPF0236 family protein [Ferruginibacter sp.]|nr:UPF0236 family protein [Ferruginibacter sp.]
MGGHKQFCTQIDKLLDDFGPLKQRLVFITDGAVWLRNWIDDSFPDSVSILDFYHAAEHLHALASQFFKAGEKGSQWVKQQKKLLLDSQVSTVIENIIKEAGNENKDAAKLIAYYQSIQNRMDYKYHKGLGCGLIGSGAIESAHRTVIQKRMKQSGQRWSINGAQNMLNLRVIRKNQPWDKIIGLTKIDFNVAA